ncbi:hypothetical protein BOX15_Mlig012545g1 [Macrostomum lignano]|uniref:TNFR-Cys domain-containing protein n=2 Tax=Macrostomum lignano TaxID=282301 RepID=A0A1I8HZ76_9PLAT|nr:hypothetical protein BOX15_Mlig012545g1 [Macrostomum lignano]
MSSCSVRCLLLLLAVAACYISVSNAHSRRCCSGRLPDGKTTNLTCTRPTPYCCRSRHPLKPVFCCSDCRKGVDYDDCERDDDDDDDHHGYWKYKYYWKYIGCAIGALVLLFVLAGLVFGLVKLFKSVCCKRRTTSVRSATAGVPSSSVDYPKNIDVAPEWQQPPKMPPGYFDVFTVTPPPDYKERPESA